MAKVTSPSSHTYLKTVTRYIRGDFEARIDSVGDDELRVLRNHLIGAKKEITLKPTDVARVLKQFVDGQVDANQLARWGSFVFHGYATWRKGSRKHPLPIRYEPASEELLAEILLEIEQIGDPVNGDFTRERAAAHLSRLLVKRR